MNKLKIKKNVKKVFYISAILLIFLSIGIYSTIKIYQQKQYEKTYEYKLLQIGYTKNETDILIREYKTKEIDYILSTDLNRNYLEIINDKYFIYDNFYQYLDYLNNNLDIPIRGIIEIVNTNRDNEYYTNIQKTDISKNELIIVNKYYSLDKDYVPESLVTISSTYSWGSYGSQKVTEDTFNAYMDMWEDAYENGYYLMVSSSYRTYDKQDSVYNEYKKTGGTEYADSYAARPGFSEHQSGYTLDIFEKTESSKKTFHTSEAYNWLKNNAHNYGFILRYPEDKENITGYSFESWHYRYVGIDAATYIYQNGITFDEYYEYFIK